MSSHRAPEDHANRRIIQHMISRIPPILGLGARLGDPDAYILDYTILDYSILEYIPYYNILHHKIAYYAITMSFHTDPDVCCGLKGPYPRLLHRPHAVVVQVAEQHAVHGGDVLQLRA